MSAEKMSSQQSAKQLYKKRTESLKHYLPSSWLKVKQLQHVRGSNELVTVQDQYQVFEHLKK